MAPSPSVSTGLKVFAILALLYEVLVCFMYGFYIRYREVTSVNFDFFTATFLCMFILVGFGLLQVYIRDIPLSGLGFTLLITAIAFQHYFLINAFWTKARIQASDDDYFTLDTKTYTGLYLGEMTTNANAINSKYFTVPYAFRCALTMVCAFSTMIGRAGPLEALLLTLFGTVTYELNSQIITRYAQDMGGSIRIFTFAGFLGFFASLVMNNQKNSVPNSHPRFTSKRWNAVLALTGTLFIWTLFPALFANILFTDAINTINNAMFYATVFNIIMALTGSVISTIFTSLMFRDRVGIRDVIHGSIAGGVSIMTSANLITNPAAALTVGVLAGIIQTFYLNKVDRGINRTSIKDSTGAFGLFGIAGLMGGIWSAIFTGFQTNYDTTKSYFSIANFSLFVSTGALQFAATWMSAGIAAVTGLVVGGILRAVNKNESEDQFNDATYWTVEDDGISTGELPEAPAMGEIRPGSEIKGKYSYM